ncbi:hypothetical protein TWF751_010252 [Orbilia oligospora]|nr:hypothetical protein TWF751_010252 [Orbilia oligospora]
MYPPAEPAKRRITRSKAAAQNPKPKSQNKPEKQSQKQPRKQLSPIVPKVWATPADAYGSLNVLPAELKLMIFDYLTPEELKIFTSSSKHYYIVYLPFAISKPDCCFKFEFCQLLPKRGGGIYPIHTLWKNRGQKRLQRIIGLVAS